MRTSVVLITLALLASGCQHEVMEPDVVLIEKRLVLPEEPYNYQDEFPESFDHPLLNLLESIPGENPLTNEGATLGRVLFYDQALSIDGSISCGSCHHQENAFADPVRFSEGINGFVTDRNSMALFNMQFHRRLFWDTRTNGLENQVLEPIQHPGEMGLTLEQMVERIEGKEYYPTLFEDAFGDATVTTQRVSFALSQFIRSLKSYRSKYDQGLAEGFAHFTDEEIHGMKLYFSGEATCNHCHTTANFFSSQPLNTGLDEVYNDPGLGGVTGNPEDNGRFKPVSLRNLSFTAPYMHDGRFETLEEVIDHYNSGVQAHPNLDDRLTYENTVGGTPEPLLLSEVEKAALKAFLLTLDDYEFIQDERFSDPFH